MIKLFITGGTIDKHYQMNDGSMGFDTTHIDAMLKLGRSTAAIDSEVLMMKDSLDLNDADRSRIVEACADCEEQRILITHGTDTMVQTASVIANDNAQSLKTKTIVLVGAMIPYEIRHSDGLFNLGFALGAVQNAPAGLHIAMNAQLFPWDRVTKNRRLGLFESTD